MHPRSPRFLHFVIYALLLCAAGAMAQAIARAQTAGPVKVTLEEAIHLALAHNHNLLAQRTTIDQNRAQEITANLRPNPSLTLDSQFLPIFNPENFTGQYLDSVAQFDAGISYLVERGERGRGACRPQRIRPQ